MASGLMDIHDLAQNPAFVRRVTASAVFAAVQVGGEEYDGSQYRIMRRALARNVVTDPETWGAVFAWGAAANPVIEIESVDGDIQYTVNSLWDAVAGAYQATSTAPEPAAS
ncbi:hypothetical protein [Amycolatopsis sp. CA-128772]|uniref:hypothetical protein n=1 Tax=Amycolatopsis sp. CA-128772 TaxID=2073159 RepID=UPI0011AFE829|nr:hypothetical protein [Amycolatopsis sp. CA-128772]